MTLEDWHQAQEVDTVLSLVIARLRDGMLGKAQSEANRTPQSQSIWARIKPSHSQTGYPIQTGQTKGIRGDPHPVGFTNFIQGGCSQRMP